MESASEDEGEMTVPGKADATVMTAAPPGLQDEPAEEGPGPEAANATVVFDTNKGARKGAAPAGPQGKLIVLKGPKQGAEFTLGAGETSIGRNADNTVVIPDISVSRKHVVLVKQGNGWVLQDQGSGNGTLVNGQTVSEHNLADGDVFSIGDTEIQFALLSNAPTARRSAVNNPVAPASPQRRPSRVQARPNVRPAHEDDEAQPEATGQVNLGGPKKRGKGPIIAAVAGVAVLTIGGAYFKKTQADKARIAQEDADRQAHDAQMAAAAETFKQGKDLARQAKWQEALTKFQEAKGQSLEDQELENYIDRAQKEIANEKLVDEAEKALTENHLASAWEALLKVPSESLMADKADEVKTKVKKAVPDRVNAARALIAPKKYAEAHAILDDASKVVPDSPDIDAANQELAKAEKTVYIPKPTHTSNAVDHTGEVVNIFKSGDMDGAKKLADQYGATDDKMKALSAQISEFQSHYEKAEADPGEMAKARDLEIKIAHGKSVFAGKLNKGQVAVFLKKGLEAKSSGQYAQAYANFQKVLDADPNNGEARAGLNELKEKAKAKYLDGYVSRGEDPEKARKLFQEVVAMTPSDDENHQKAQARLKEMANQ